MENEPQQPHTEVSQPEPTHPVARILEIFMRTPAPPEPETEAQPGTIGNS